eukprot:scaffold938_cov334-Pavlova_lutheri.AAC.12
MELRPLNQQRQILARAVGFSVWFSTITCSGLTRYSLPHLFQKDTMGLGKNYPAANSGRSLED